MTFERAEVREGQVWADNDPRAHGRTLRVDAVDGDYARCTVLSGVHSSWIGVGRECTILLRRFAPTRSGYRLLILDEDEDLGRCSFCGGQEPRAVLNALDGCCSRRCEEMMLESE